MNWHHVISRSNLRLASALVMLSFVICHLTAHAFLLVSLETAGKVLDVLMFPWRTIAGTALLTAASSCISAMPCGRSISGVRCG